MKLLLLVLTIAALTGCGVVLQGELRGGIQLCADNGGIYKIRPRGATSIFTCQNGAEFNVKDDGSVWGDRI